MNNFEFSAFLSVLLSLISTTKGNLDFYRMTVSVDEITNEIFKNNFKIITAFLIIFIENA